MNRVRDGLGRGRCRIFTMDARGRVMFCDMRVGAFVEDNSAGAPEIAFISNGNRRVVTDTSPEALYEIILLDNHGEIGIYLRGRYRRRVGWAADATAAAFEQFTAAYPYASRCVDFLCSMEITLLRAPARMDEAEEEFARGHISAVDAIWAALPMPIAEAITEEYGYEFIYENIVQAAGVTRLATRAGTVFVGVGRIRPWEVAASGMWIGRLLSYRTAQWTEPARDNPFANYSALERAYAVAYPLCSQLFDLVISPRWTDDKYKKYEAHLVACGWTPTAQ